MKAHEILDMVNAVCKVFHVVAHFVGTVDEDGDSYHTYEIDYDHGDLTEAEEDMLDNALSDLCSETDGLNFDWQGNHIDLSYEIKE